MLLQSECNGATIDGKLQDQLEDEGDDTMLITQEEIEGLLKDGIIKKIPKPGTDYMVESQERSTKVATVTITFHYTPEFKAKHWNVEKFARKLVNQINENYQENHLPIRMKLYCVLPTKFRESNVGWRRGRPWRNNPNSKPEPLIFFLEGFNYDDKKARNSADIAMILVAGKPRGVPGAAWTGDFAMDYGHSIGYTNDKAATKTYTFDHEVGHMFGAQHDRKEVPERDQIEYGHGKVINDRYRTIMAYPPNWYNKRVRYYSSKDIKIKDSQGVYDLGDYYHDVRRLLYKNRFRISSIGDESMSCPTPLFG